MSEAGGGGGLGAIGGGGEVAEIAYARDEQCVLEHSAADLELHELLLQLPHRLLHAHQRGCARTLRTTVYSTVRVHSALNSLRICK